MSEWSETWTYMDGEWFEGNVPVMGPRDHAFWLGSSVFDGARAFEGVTPDLDLHCERLNKSALALGLKPTMSAVDIEKLCIEGVSKFAPDAALYIRPMYFADQNGPRLCGNSVCFSISALRSIIGARSIVLFKV